MNKLKRLVEEKHDQLAGVFGVLALASIAFEIVLGGFSTESLVAGIKDLSGILIDILVLLVAMSVLIKKSLNFKEKFNEAMETIREKYAPLVVLAQKEGSIRYNIASETDALFGGEAKSPERIFELAEQNPDKITFFVNKSFFSHKGAADFDPKGIATEIALRLQKVYKEYDVATKPVGANYSIVIDFKRSLKYNEDIDALIALIDYTLFLFVARNKS